MNVFTKCKASDINLITMFCKNLKPYHAKNLKIWFYGYMVLWFHRYMVIWLYGFMVYGCMVLWLSYFKYGFMMAS